MEEFIRQSNGGIIRVKQATPTLHDAMWQLIQAGTKPHVIGFKTLQYFLVIDNHKAGKKWITEFPEYRISDYRNIEN